MKWLPVVLLMVGAVLALMIYHYAVNRPEPEPVEVAPTPTPKPRTAELSATVRFTGTQFVVTNVGPYRWADVELEVNDGYTYKFDSLEPGATATVGALQFANKGGERFNPYKFKPGEFTIWAKLPDGRRGLWVGGWK